MDPQPRTRSQLGDRSGDESDADFAAERGAAGGDGKSRAAEDHGGRKGGFKRRSARFY